MPPFAVGRAGFDNWLVWKARQVGIVVDATHDVRAVHQPHGYEHVTGGMDEAYYGEEAARNLELAGGKGHVYTLHDASHVLRDGKLRRNLARTAALARERPQARLEGRPEVRVAFVSPSRRRIARRCSIGSPRSPTSS